MQHRLGQLLAVGVDLAATSDRDSVAWIALERGAPMVDAAWGLCVLGDRQFASVDGDIPEAYEAAIVDAMARGASIHGDDLVVEPLIVDGSVIGGLAFGGALVGEARLIVGLLAQQVALAAERARLAETLRARDEMLATVSHDLRNPLNTIVMGTSMIAATADGRVKQLGQRIGRQADRMARMLGDLVDFAGIQNGQLLLDLSPNAPADIVAATSEMFTLLAEERGLGFATRAIGELPRVACDPDRAVQALSNLVAHAVKTTPRGGQIEIGAAPGADGVVFFVSGGLDEHEHRGAFGLSLARGIVDAHGGRLWAESQPGVGSTYYIAFAS